MIRRPLRSLGPAIIVASVVLGPGSILTSSRVGCDFGYELVWVLAGAVILMIGMTATSAWLGTHLDATLCAETRARAGRPLAGFVGVVLFLVVACFQFSNNVSVIAAFEPFLGRGDVWPVAVVVGINVAAAGALLGLRRLYRPVERLMKLLIGVMILGFAGNLFYAQPSLERTLSGLLPTMRQADVLPVLGLVGTTFSVAGAFYQSYLVRKKGWTRRDSRLGVYDSVIGIGVLGFLSLTIMVTAAAVLHGSVRGNQLESAADVALQLEPLFGPSAKVLFCAGLFAGAFSSFLVNAMIGGTVLADGLGLGSDIDGIWPKLCTLLALATGMVVAVFVQAGGSAVQLIIFAQAMTVLGNPVLAGVMLWLAIRARAPLWMRLLVGVGFGVVLLLAYRTIDHLREVLDL